MCMKYNCDHKPAHKLKRGGERSERWNQNDLGPQYKEECDVLRDSKNEMVVAGQAGVGHTREFRSYLIDLGGNSGVVLYFDLLGQGLTHAD